MAAVFHCDWRYALNDHGTSIFIQKKDDRTQAVEDCRDVFLENVRSIYAMFDYFATLGTGSLLDIQYSSYKKFVGECRLIVPQSTSLGVGAFDRLFLLVNAGSDNIRALDRQEFLQVIIRIAWVKYEGKFSRFCDALRALLESVIIPRVDSRALHNATTFRELYCYTHEVSEVLQEHRESLVNLFKARPSRTLSPQLSRNAGGVSPFCTLIHVHVPCAGVC